MNSTGQLKQVFRGPSPYKAIFIIVPGAGTIEPEDWDNGQGESWLRGRLLASIGQQAVFVFRHALASAVPLTWHGVQVEGGKLLAQVKLLAKRPEFKTLPIVFISHSLGGVVVKRAICSAYRREALAEVPINAAVFISCPHSKDHSPSAWKSVALISRAYPESRIREPVSGVLAESLADDCSDFVKALEKIPVLSIFETKETKTGRQSWNKTMIIDEACAKIGLPHETVIGTAREHSHSCCLNAEGATLQQLKEFLESNINGVSSKEDPEPQNFEQPGHGDAPRADNNEGARHNAPKAESTSEDHDDALPERRDPLPDFTYIEADPQLPLFYMPYDRNQGFCGRREQIERIAQHLDPAQQRRDSSGITTFVISGTGGIGKTQLAVEYVHKYKARYDAVLWISAEWPGKMRQALSRIAVQLGLVDKDSVEAKDKLLTKDLVLGWLARPLSSYRRRANEELPRANWLLIFDNVENQAELDEFWPHGASGHVLLTSRDPFADAESHFYSTNDSIQLTPFSPEDTADLLLKLTGRASDQADRENVHKVAELLGGLPLAITQMAGVIARRNISFQEFRETYEDEVRRQGIVEEPVISRKVYEHTLASVWGFENLKHSKDLLDILSFLDPDGIPEQILQDFEVHTDMGGFPTSIEAYERARTELLNSSLATRDREEKKLVIHRLIQDTVRTKMSSDRYSAVFTSVLELISAVWPYQDNPAFRNETDRWDLCSELYGHVRGMVRLSRTSKQQPPVKFTSERLEPAKVLLEAAWFSIMRSEFEHTEELLQMAWAMFEPLQRDQEGLQHQDREVIEDFEAQIELFQFHPGSFALHANEPEKSLPHLKAYRSLVSSKLGEKPYDQSQGVAWNELGNAYLQNKATLQAEECFRQSIDALQDLQDATANTVSMPIINLGFALWLQKKLPEAEQIFSQALTNRQYAYGPADTTSFATGKLYLGYANVKADQGQLQESFELHQKCVDLYKSVLGPYHHRTADGSVRLADHHIRRGELEQAKQLLNNAHRVYQGRKAFVPECARTYYKCWKLAIRMKDTKLAEEFAEKALTLHREKHKEDTRGIKELSDKDFDEDIMFWSR